MAKSEMIALRISSDDKKNLKEIADKNGLSLSSYIVMVLKNTVINNDDKE